MGDDSEVDGQLKMGRRVFWGPGEQAAYAPRQWRDQA
jgi:hypothetical protein